MATPVQPPRKHRRYFSIPTDVDGLKALLKPLFEAGYFEGVPTDADTVAARADAYGRPLLILIVESADFKDSQGMAALMALRRVEAEPSASA